MNREDLMFKPDLLAGQRILVTGGGTGLGLVMGEAFVALGAQLYICGRREAVLQQAAGELQSRHGGRVVALGCDLRSPESIGQMLDGIWADGGPLTGLVNNAAANFISRTEDISARGFDAIANTVFRGSFLVTAECGRRWLAGGSRASVLSIVATWVWNGSAFTVPSAMSKAGVAAMTQSLAVEWGGRGIRLNAIAPGVFPTEGMSARLDPTGQILDPQRNPMKRHGQMAELANLAVFLMAPGSEYLNGQTIAIDGAQYQATGGNFAALTDWSPADWAAARERIDARTSRDKADRSA